MIQTSTLKVSRTFDIETPHACSENQKTKSAALWLRTKINQTLFDGLVSDVVLNIAVETISKEGKQNAVGHSRYPRVQGGISIDRALWVKTQLSSQVAWTN